MTAAIAGIGQTEFSKDSGRSELQLAVESVLAATRDAGLTVADVDGFVTFSQDANDEITMARALGIPELKWTARTGIPGGAGASATIQLAAAAVEAGMADNVVIYRAFNERSGRRFGQPLPVMTAPVGMAPYLPFGLDTPAKFYTLWYERYMREFGVTNEDLGRYVVIARQYAATNPNSWFYKRPITLEDHQASRWIVEPVLRKLDCCQESDGGVAVLVTSLERARDLPHPPVIVSSSGQSNLLGGDVMFNYYHPDLAEFAEARVLGERLYREAGITPDDISVAMLYENFSPVVFLMLEAFGFCGRGEAKDFIKSGEIGPTGKTPVNTHGGLLGEAYIHGVNNILEAVRQLRGTAPNQIPGAEHVLVSAGRSAAILTRG